MFLAVEQPRVAFSQVSVSVATLSKGILERLSKQLSFAGKSLQQIMNLQFFVSLGILMYMLGKVRPSVFVPHSSRTSTQNAREKQ